MFSLRNKLCVFMSFVLLFSLLTACSQGAGTGSSSEPSSKIETPKSEASVTSDTPASAEEGKTGFPIVNEPITLTVFGSRDQNQANWSDIFVLKEYEKMTNIHMDYQEVPSQGFDEKKNLLFVSNDLPDIFVRCDLKPYEVSMYGPGSGQLLALNDLIEQYAPNLSAIFKEYPAIKSSVTAPDGNIYTIPSINLSDTGRMDFKQWINKDWLAVVGKSIPTNIDEFKDVLIAFRDGDPNGNGEQDEIPLGIREPRAVYQLGGSFGLGYQMRDTCNIDENGKIHYWLTDDRFREYLEFLNELYREKLLWQDYYKKDIPAWRSNLANAQYGIMYMPYSDVFKDVENQFTGFDPLVGPHGDQIWSDAFSGTTTAGAFALSSTCKNPEAAIRWVDYFFSDEGSIFFSYGIEGETYSYDADGSAKFNDEILNDEQGFMTALGKINLIPGGGFPYMSTNKTDGVVASALTKQVANQLAKYLPKKVYAKPTVSESDMERVNAIVQDLENYRDEAVTKFILGEWGFDKWEEYCKTLNQIGLPELEEIYQRALDS